MTVDPSGPEHICKQISDTLRTNIATGRIAVNDRIANELELAEQLGVSRGSVRKALDLLVQEGLLMRIKGKGTFVAQATADAGSTQNGRYRADYVLSDNVGGAHAGVAYLLSQGHTRVVCGTSPGRPVIPVTRGAACTVSSSPISTNSTG